MHGVKSYAQTSPFNLHNPINDVLFLPMFLLKQRRLREVLATGNGQKWDSNQSLQGCEAGVSTFPYTACLKTEVFLMSKLVFI